MTAVEYEEVRAAGVEDEGIVAADAAEEFEVGVEAGVAVAGEGGEIVATAAAAYAAVADVAEETPGMPKDTASCLVGRPAACHSHYYMAMAKGPQHCCISTAAGGRGRTGTAGEGCTGIDRNWVVGSSSPRYTLSPSEAVRCTKRAGRKITDAFRVGAEKLAVS